MAKYEDILELQGQRSREHALRAARQVPSAHTPKPVTAPPQRPGGDSSARELFDYWRKNQGLPLVVNFLSMALGKILDRLEALETAAESRRDQMSAVNALMKRVETLEADAVQKGGRRRETRTRVQP